MFTLQVFNALGNYYLCVSEFSINIDICFFRCHFVVVYNASMISFGIEQDIRDIRTFMHDGEFRGLLVYRN